MTSSLFLKKRGVPVGSLSERPIIGVACTSGVEGSFARFSTQRCFYPLLSTAQFGKKPIICCSVVYSLEQTTSISAFRERWVTSNTLSFQGQLPPALDLCHQRSRTLAFKQGCTYLQAPNTTQHIRFEGSKG